MCDGGLSVGESIPRESEQLANEGTSVIIIIIIIIIIS